MPPLDLYARVRFLVSICTRDRGCSVHPAFPAPSLFEGREINPSLGRIAPRDCKHTSGVIARLDRATQYSRDVDDRTEKPQRTGSPAFAGDDSFVCGRTTPVIARSPCDEAIHSSFARHDGLLRFARNDGGMTCPP
jgi:hypothetical protein